MPVFAISEGLPSDFDQVVDLMLGDPSGPVALLTMTPTSLSYMFGASLVTWTGTGFTYLNFGGTYAILSGTISSININVNGVPGQDIDLTGLNLDIAVLIAATQDYLAGNLSAVNDLLLTQDWVVNDNSSAFDLPVGYTDDDGNVVNFEGNDVFNLNGGNDLAWAGDGNDTVNGGAGNDTVNGGLGADSLVGGGGDDWLNGSAGNDIIKGGGGADRATGGAGDDRIFGGNGNDILSGNAGRDRVFGGVGDDRISGGSGNDILKGNDGQDIIRGGTGKDQLFGGAQADTFIFSAGDGVDRIRDFDPTMDILRFEGLTDVTVRAGNGNGAVVFYDGGRVLLAGVDIADVDPSDFVFA